MAQELLEPVIVASEEERGIDNISLNGMMRYLARAQKDAKDSSTTRFPPGPGRITIHWLWSSVPASIHVLSRVPMLFSPLLRLPAFGREADG